jgi:hypothetical protein
MIYEFLCELKKTTGASTISVEVGPLDTLIIRGHWSNRQWACSTEITRTEIESRQDSALFEKFISAVNRGADKYEGKS